MKIDVKHIQKRGKAGWRYRRKIPKELRAAAGKLEILITLGSTEQEALRAYPKAHAQAEQQLRLWSRPQNAVQSHGSSSTPSPTEFEQFRLSRARLKALNLDPEWSGAEDAEDPEALARELIAEHIADKYPVDERGHPVGIGTEDRALIHALVLGDRQHRPDPTLEDAKRLYLKERVGEDETKRMELDRVFKLVRDALGKDRKLSSLKREDAKEVRDHMLDGRKASSVDRYLNVVRAVINHAIREFDLVGVINPFMNLEAAPKDKAEPDKDKRRPFTQAEVTAITARISYHAKADLQYIWAILNGTGCRLAEISGLRVGDVHLDQAIPHITVEWHDDRRIKNKVSRRNVPLIGGALEAAKEAVKAAGSATMLFPTYGRPKGASSASAALGKHVRACVTDPKATTHSLRHLMKDRLRLAGVTKSDQDIVLGHSSGSVGEDYGGDEARLEMARRALEKALTKAN
ncbi:tyrosine-type recombinase/integrase [Mesorhizobium sp.]|uniref:tyrosine-type recombinase/integrase n=1 Tax=Mesorhizobium sp. TaxID=1871066 RepID=UPI0011FA75CC|nr:tyrosine-type recombinase/integrase [Mesorhizobium sp.]TIL43656.1 MAG: integrase [Mesorhizobium sp.]